MSAERLISEVKKTVDKAVMSLFEHDAVLLEINASERSISHKLAEYLQQMYSTLRVDCEYNRYGDVKKELDFSVNFGEIDAADTDAKTVFPDIIVHERKSNVWNLLVVEIKKKNNRVGADNDKVKLRAFTRMPFSYAFGLFLEFDGCRVTQEIWFSEGEEKCLAELGYLG